jgi:hypothetical protein
MNSRRMRWKGHVERMGEECTQGFGRNAVGKETNRIPKQSWEGNIKIVVEK